MTRLSATARKVATARQAGTGVATSSLRSLQGEGMPSKEVLNNNTMLSGNMRTI